MSVDLTAHGLIAWGRAMEVEYPCVATDALLKFGYAWQAEVRALRERIAALEERLEGAEDAARYESDEGL